MKIESCNGRLPTTPKSTPQHASYRTDRGTAKGMSMMASLSAAFVWRNGRERICARGLTAPSNGDGHGRAVFGPEIGSPQGAIVQLRGWIVLSPYLIDAECNVRKGFRSPTSARTAVNKCDAGIPCTPECGLLSTPASLPIRCLHPRSPAHELWRRCREISFSTRWEAFI
jgi:hypothetical protein